MADQPSPRIGIIGTEDSLEQESRGCCLWPPGYSAAITAATGTPVTLELPESGNSWDEALAEIDGLLFIGNEASQSRQATAETKIYEWCRKKKIPVLGVDRGLHVLNTTFGGSIFLDLAKEQPQALQHRHPPERGLRHTIAVDPNTRLAQMYGEGEIVVNSEHRRAVSRLARGFRVSARALDGVIEAIEAESEDWFAVGVQWQPASASASGLDIQLFRGLIDACLQFQEAELAATSAA